MKKIKDLSRLEIAELTRQLPKDKGSYLLVFRMRQPHTIRVGKLTETRFAAGYYVYVGSAFGPGGLQARLRHHLTFSERCHWHLDYLRPVLHFEYLYLSRETESREHDWAAVLQQLEGAEVPVRDLGATDCSCNAHFFYFQHCPDPDQLKAQLQSASAGAVQATSAEVAPECVARPGRQA